MGGKKRKKRRQTRPLSSVGEDLTLSYRHSYSTNRSKGRGGRLPRLSQGVIIQRVPRSTAKRCRPAENEMRESRRASSTYRTDQLKLRNADAATIPWRIPSAAKVPLRCQNGSEVLVLGEQSYDVVVARAPHTVL